MAVTVVKTPQGHKIIDQAITATITNSGGDALVNLTAHGLSDGAHVYVDSDIEEYNGFWYVDAAGSNSFRLKESATGDYVEYYQDADIDYYLTNPHEWSAVFLPIVYKITNDRWPENTADAGTNINNYFDDNGYLEVETYGTIKSDIKIFDYVKIANSPDETLNGVWQVIEVISSSHVVLDAPASDTDLTGTTVYFHYNNYQVKVKVYAGLPPGHPWEDRKPYEEVAELSLTPDENNEVMFSVADYIKNKVTIRNNPTLYSMPLNLDFFTGFYISTAESFDDSDGYTITEYESDYTDDTFEGYAVAGKLPFKNLYSGFYSNYVYTDGSPAQWLTNQERLLAVEDRYFDLSFIKNIIGNFVIRIDKYIADYLTATEDVEYTDQGMGVYRIPITADAGYDSFCVTAIRSADPDTFTPATMDALEDWTNLDTGSPAWVLDGIIPEADTTDLGLSITSDKWHTDYAFEAGRAYTFGYEFESLISREFHIDIVDVSGVALTSKTVTFFGTITDSYTFVAPTGATGISIWFFSGASCGSGSGNCIAKILSFTNDTEVIPSYGDLTITEEICIDILESCDAVSGFTPTDIRLLEDGSYRILE